MRRAHWVLAVIYAVLAVSALAVQIALLRLGRIPHDPVAGILPIMTLAPTYAVQLVWGLLDERGMSAPVALSKYAILLPALAGSIMGTVVWIMLIGTIPHEVRGHVLLYYVSVSTLVSSPILMTWHIGAAVRIKR